MARFGNIDPGRTPRRTYLEMTPLVWDMLGTMRTSPEVNTVIEAYGRLFFVVQLLETYYTNNCCNMFANEVLKRTGLVTLPHYDALSPLVNRMQNFITRYITDAGFAIDDAVELHVILVSDVPPVLRVEVTDYGLYDEEY